MEEKEKNNSRTNLVVAIGAGLLLVALIGFIVFKLQKSINATNAITETVDTITDTKHYHQADTAKPKTAVLDSAKFAALFAQYFKKDSTPTQYPKFLTEAFIGYNFGDYLYFKQMNFEALPETLETMDGNTRETIIQLGHYYKGIAGLMVNNPEQAITNLQWSISHCSHEISIKAKWFLALTYIKLVQSNKAIGLLESVAASNVSGYSKQAKQLLEDLKKD